MKFATCHPDRQHKAHGMCRPCYAARKRPNAQCRHTDRPERARGLCGACYEAKRVAESPEYAARLKARKSVFYAANSVRICAVERSRYAKGSGESAWAHNIRAKYGVSTEWVREQSAKQDDACLPG